MVFIGLTVRINNMEAPQAFDKKAFSMKILDMSMRFSSYFKASL